MLDSILRIATRKSPLALWQANYVKQQLLHYWPTLKIELLPLITSGDRHGSGSKGLFIKELEEALYAQHADLAVHSIKDMPMDLPDGLVLSTICKRGNPYDALLSHKYKSLNALPMHARVGTASLRRQAQTLALRPDLTLIPLRGNIQTRIQALEQGKFDAIILAHAGLERMQLQHLIKQNFTTQQFLPACAQGAIGIETRANDQQLQKLLHPLNDTNTALCVNIERQVNKLLGGHCHAPIAIYCQLSEHNIVNLQAKVLSVDGSQAIYQQELAPLAAAHTLATIMTNNLIARGAIELLNKL